MMKMKIARRSDVLLLLIPVAVGLMWDFGRPADAARAPRLAAQPSPVSQAPPARPAEPLSFRRLWQAQTRGSVSVTLLGFYRGYPIQEDGNSRSGVAVAYLVEYLGDEPVGPTSRRLPEWTTSDAHNVLAPRVLIQAIDYDVVKNCRPEIDLPPVKDSSRATVVIYSGLAALDTDAHHIRLEEGFNGKAEVFEYWFTAGSGQK